MATEQKGFSWEAGVIVASTDTQFIIKLPDDRRIRMVKRFVPKSAPDKILIKTSTFLKALAELDESSNDSVGDLKNAVFRDPLGFLQKFFPNFSRHHITNVKVDEAFCYVTLKSTYPMVGKVPIVFVQNWAGLPLCSHLNSGNEGE